MNVKKAFIVIFAVLSLMLAGCATQTPASAPNPAASAAKPLESSTPAPEAKKTDDSLKKFGDVMTYKDGVSISISEPTAFEASKHAAGMSPGVPQFVYTLVLTNNSTQVLDPMVYATVSSGGAESKAIFDLGNPIGEIGGSPSTAVLPGQTVKWLEAYSIVDPKAVTFQISPSFAHTKVIFTNIQK